MQFCVDYGAWSHCNHVSWISTGCQRAYGVMNFKSGPKLRGHNNMLYITHMVHECVDDVWVTVSVNEKFDDEYLERLFTNRRLLYTFWLSNKFLMFPVDLPLQIIGFLENVLVQIKPFLSFQSRGCWSVLAFLCRRSWGQLSVTNRGPSATMSRGDRGPKEDCFHSCLSLGV